MRGDYLAGSGTMEAGFGSAADNDAHGFHTGTPSFWAVMIAAAALLVLIAYHSAFKGAVAS